MTTQVFDTFKRSAIGLPFRVAYRRWVSNHSVKDLTLVRVRPQADPSDVVCMAVVLNEMMRLLDFLRHYRALGVGRFIFIDNGSTDRSVEFLLDQADVDLVSTQASYSASDAGIFWGMGLTRHLGLKGWIVRVDADEHLIYDGFEDHDLHDLIGLLEARGRRSLPVMMLDMYPEGPIRDALPMAEDRLVDICPLFDGVGYGMKATQDRSAVRRITSYMGGPRARLFSTGEALFRCELAKTPLVRWDSGVTQMHAHGVHPYALNFGLPTGSLLHFKLLHDFHDRAKEAVALGNHYNNSSEYRRYLARVDAEPDMSAAFEGSRRYVNSRSVVDAGLMASIDWR